MYTIVINYVLRVKIYILYIYKIWFNARNLFFISEEWATMLYYWPPALICVFSSICLFTITALKIARYEKDRAHLKDSESRLYDENKKWFVLKHLCITICNDLLLLMRCIPYNSYQLRWYFCVYHNSPVYTFRKYKI